MTLKQIKERFQRWAANHPDVFHDEDTFWYVQNCVGDLINWKELPTAWLDEDKKRTKKTGSRVRQNSESASKASGREMRAMLESLTASVRPSYQARQRKR